MKSIDKNIKNEIIIKKSRFICHLYQVNNIDDIKQKINYIKDEYKDATHNCYAYICGNLKKMSDDGEPSGTAGLPILNILETNKLDNVLAIVTRYFGGIKLGANGLVRAYADSVKGALDKINIIELIKGIKIKIEFSYDNVKQIDYLLKDFDITEKNYNSNITYILNLPYNNEIQVALAKYLISYEEIETVFIIKKEMN